MTSRYGSKLTKVKDGKVDKWNAEVYANDIPMWNGYKLYEIESAKVSALVYAANFLKADRADLYRMLKYQIEPYQRTEADLAYEAQRTGMKPEPPEISR